jgi:hypothetical protein
MRFCADGFEIHHLTCMVCGALPGTTCIDDDYQELAEVHPSRRLSIQERNRRFGEGWVPPEVAERRRERRAREIARAPLFDPRLGPGVAAVLRLSGSPGRWVPGNNRPAIKGRAG